MLTLDNTAGFSQEDLDKMNEEVESLIQKQLDDIIDPSFEMTPDDEANFRQWAEEEVLKKYGGA